VAVEFHRQVDRLFEDLFGGGARQPVALFASSSARSLPLIPTCAGTHCTSAGLGMAFNMLWIRRRKVRAACRKGR
jgi:hypothetical protein